jgi:thiol-disulfide isomerase/thioredoxin
MSMKKANWILIIIVLIIVGGLIGLLVVEGKKPGQYDDLAQCISDSGAKFYGAFWCPHCQATKAMFGKSAKLLPYVECSDGQKQLPICDQQDIQSYPTWIFKDGSRLSGERTLEELAQKTSCEASLNIAK